jgi:hypothetical protein
MHEISQRCGGFFSLFRPLNGGGELLATTSAFCRSSLKRFQTLAVGTFLPSFIERGIAKPRIF